MLAGPQEQNANRKRAKAMRANNSKKTNRISSRLTLVSARVMPVVINNFRNKLIGVVLAGLVLPQMAYAGHGHGGGGRSGGGSSSRSSSMLRSSNSMKSFAQKSSNFQSGGQKQFAKKSFSGPIPAKNGNTGINGSGLPDRVVAFPNGNTGFTGKGKPSNLGRTSNLDKGNGFISGTGLNSKPSQYRQLGKKSGSSSSHKLSDVATTKSNQSWKQFRDSAVTKKTGGTDKGGKLGIKTRKDFEKIIVAGGMKPGNGPGQPGDQGGKGPGNGGGGNGGGGGKGNGGGQGKGGHGHGFPWWQFVAPRGVGYPGYPGYCPSGVYQQPVPVYVESPVVVTEAPVYAAPFYTAPIETAPAPIQPAPTQPAPIQPAPTQPVSLTTDGYVDLIVEDVEFLEPATITVGPLYLVKVRNQGTALSSKFRIGAFAQLEGELSDDAPRSVTEVPSLGAGETASVTLRLPAAAMKLISISSAGANAFNQLLVVADLDDVVVETEKTNNVATLDRAALEAAATH